VPGWPGPPPLALGRSRLSGWGRIKRLKRSAGDEAAARLAERFAGSSAKARRAGVER
jgi:hypothetical protein